MTFPLRGKKRERGGRDGLGGGEGGRERGREFGRWREGGGERERGREFGRWREGGGGEREFSLHLKMNLSYFDASMYSI